MTEEIDVLSLAIEYLESGAENEAAKMLRECSIENVQIVDTWMDGNRMLDGLFIELVCPRAVYEILNTTSNPITQSIHSAIAAVIPSDSYIKGIVARVGRKSNTKIGPDIEKRSQLLKEVDKEKSLMISVSTGGPRINEVNNEYKEGWRKISELLRELGIENPNPYSDLWKWHGKWSDGSLPTYQSRRQYIFELFQPLETDLTSKTNSNIIKAEPTGWPRVDRVIEKTVLSIERAKKEEDFQASALLCREAIISLAQAVYIPEEHGSLDGIVPSDTDANRKLEAYIIKELEGKSNEELRKYAKDCFRLAVSLQHDRCANFRNAAICVEATRSIVNIIAIISGRRDPD